MSKSKSRQLRRAAEREARKQQTQVTVAQFRSSLPEEYFAQKVKEMERMHQNGITAADLKANYDKGYKEGRMDMVTFTMANFYSAIAIAMKRLYGHGETRILRTLNDVQLIMTEEITVQDLIERCKRETGVDIIANGYTN